MVKKAQKKVINVVSNYIVNLFSKIKVSVANFMSRRPHRSFKKTNRRDYIKPLKLPGYWAFSVGVLGFCKKNRKILILVALVYAVITGLMVGLASQDTYTTLSGLLQDTGGEIIK